MPPVWRSLMRACGRVAERGETARRFAERALVRDVRQELMPSLSQRLDQIAGNGQGSLPGFEPPLATLSYRPGAHPSPFEQSIVSEMRRLESEGARGRALKQRAVQDGVRVWAERRMRHIEQYGLAKGGADAMPSIRAARAALGSVVADVAERVLPGGSAKVTAVRRPLDLDEDLAKPK